MGEQICLTHFFWDCSFPSSSRHNVVKNLLALPVLTWHKKFVRGFKADYWNSGWVLSTSLSECKAWGVHALLVSRRSPYLSFCLSFCYLNKEASHGNPKTFFHVLIKNNVRDNWYLLKILEKFSNIRNSFTLLALFYGTYLILNEITILYQLISVELKCNQKRTLEKY